MAVDRYDFRDGRQERLKECVANDEWAIKIFKDVAILVMSYPGQRAYLKYCVESHAKLGYFIALAYDNYIDPASSTINHNDFMPDKEILDKVDLLLLPHHQTWLDTDYPFFWGLKWGSAALSQFKYVYCVNGDFIIDKPEGFGELLTLMGDADIMTCGPDLDDWVANGAFIIKSEYFVPMVKFMQDTYIPFENYEKYSNFVNGESRMAYFINNFGLKKMSVPKPTGENWDDPIIIPGTWNEIVGLRHIHGELDYSFKRKLIPPHYKYLEEKYLLPVYNYKLVKEYWDTQDIKVLNNWWRK